MGAGRDRRALLAGAAALCATLGAAGCRASAPSAPAPAPAPQGGAPADPASAARPADPEPATVVSGESIVVAGVHHPIGARVVLWTEPPYFDAYREVPRFGAPADGEPPPTGLRFRRGRESVGPEPAPDALARAVDLCVLHYDAAGSSERCFRVLHDLRGLSAHFLVDVDGTIYQTLDAREQAWHATRANPRSVGIEIANLGAYPPDAADPLWRAYGVAPGAARAPSPDGSGATVAFVEGVVQGERLVQPELTRAQLDALVHLVAGLCRALPAIRADAPRDAAGRVRAAALSDAEFAAFRGILGHHHVQANKLDPGPAFPWEPFLERVRAELAQP